ncbi:formate dehydrogenase subunit gamma [Carboxydocella sp. ULO1]|uniref:formate dehydrogenase subunit gamma n=1 Tax=Carboxydocella sp. ULO1 TaxID=1926599 RepID=UPI0009AD903E|nr:cytochrome b/b6 domain-containing protein [Carboxydocella sp. ULO1]AVX30630.1 formate dehydrogenase, gamma subunit [Carboxydocella thermautotrophica]GAW28376.1 hypothetical protein ULO1_09460 [Carboxydocella sp. ULO1]
MAILHEEGKVIRHKLATRIIHWLVALSTFTLFFSGIMQMPMAKRYGIASIPGLQWSANFALTLKIHYWAAAVLIFAAFYHLALMIILKEYDILPRRGDLKESIHIIKCMLTGQPEPEHDKYLAEQRVAYGYMAISFALIIITGALKVYKNMPGVDLSPDTVWWLATLHNIGTGMLAFGIVAHLAAFLIKENRHLLPSMLNGKVSLEYCLRRHPLRMAKLMGMGKKEGA